MTLPIIAAFGQAIFKLLLSAMAIFLILLVLVQRGRGGGLAGALGGMGGSSAFGAKAGDVFTRVTIVAASIWIVLCIVAAKMAPSSESRLNTGGLGSPPPSASAGLELTAPAEEEGESGPDQPVDEQDSSEPAPGGETASEDGQQDQQAEQ